MKAIYLLFGLVLLGLFSSCEDFLEEEPKANLAVESFYKDMNDITLAVNGTVERALSGSGTMGSRGFSAIAYGDDIMTTNHGENKAQQREIDQFNVSVGNSQLNDAWNGSYEVINQANAVLGNYESAITESNLTEVEAMVSIARFYRALYYFELVRGWGDIPMPTSSVVDTKLARSPAADVFNLVANDLEEAIKWLPNQQGSNRAYPTVWAAKTLLADVYMTMAGWPLKMGAEYYGKALTLLTDVKDKSGASLEPDYATLYTYHFDEGKNYVKEAEYNNEFIFQLIGIYRTVQGYGYATNMGVSYVDSRFGGWNDIVVEIGYFQRFPRDDRFAFTFNEFGHQRPTDNEPNPNETVPWQQFNSGHPTFKRLQYNWLIPFEWFRDNYRNFDVYRYTEVLLMFAEADAMVDNDVSADAYAAINSVRERANKSKIDAGADPISFHLEAGLSAEAFRDAVLEEVSFEIGGDGNKRWFDLQRTEKVEWANARKADFMYNEDGSDLTFNNDGTNTDEPYPARRLFDLPPLNSIDKGRYYMPIPAGEILLNANLEQYPPYN
ncbi:RagB/SusD family nutrient uptake outer membrane protein [Labilibacter marinus]|uniref:RagB/SusD family nutrient uptake outer membrane protein n=1 Tax=Labilibacter marinus TaxID=1477105 RepID=UPI0009502CBF|nr:RagB/SusD family nutrient uptake outer membrane protein [Labilibacter marinus]